MLSDDDRFAALQEYYPQAKKKTGVYGRRASVYRSSKAMRRRAACCVWVLKSSAIKKARCRALLGAFSGRINRGTDHAASGWKSV